jgi:hypothetical protein
MRRGFLLLILGALPGRALAGPELGPPIASYKISCRFDESKRTIEGSELLTWKNATSRPASTLRLRLPLNAFRNTRSTYFRETQAWPDADGAWGSLSISRLMDEQGEDLAADLHFFAPDDGNTDDRTVADVPLARPVAPGEIVHLSLDFVARLPRLAAGTGWHGSFVIASGWFPKVGVLTESGWVCHQVHTAIDDFSDFGNYDVSLDIPARLKGKVGGTGRLLEERDAPEGRVIEHFRGESIHDFVWTADARYEIFNDRLTEPGKGEVALALLSQPAHRPEVERTFRAAKTALSRFAKRFGAYPYEILTICDPPWGAEAASGLSWPMLLSTGPVSASASFDQDLEEVTIRGVAGQYFPGLLASDPYLEPWLDGGFAAYSSGRLLPEIYGDAHPVIRFFGYPIVLKSVAVHSPFDVWRTAPPGAPPRGDSWRRMALALATFQRTAGEHSADGVFAAYAERFRFRHPRTSDFLAIVAQVSGSSRAALLEQMIFGTEALDFAVVDASSRRSRGPVGLLDRNGREEEVNEPERRAGYDTEVLVARRGTTPLPVDVQLQFAGATHKTRWDAKSSWIRFRVENGPPLVSARIDPEDQILLDEDHNNNGLTVKSNASAANLWTARVFFWAENVFDLFMELW